MIDEALEKKEKAMVPASSSTLKASKKGVLTAPVEKLASKPSKKDKKKEKKRARNQKSLWWRDHPRTKQCASRSRRESHV